MTRPRQGMPCSCSFNVMRQSEALIDSIYLALTLICWDAARQTASGPMESVSQLQNVFHFFLFCSKGVQTCIHSSNKRPPILSGLRFSFMRLSVESACSKVASIGAKIWQVVIRVLSLNTFKCTPAAAVFILLRRGRWLHKDLNCINQVNFCKIIDPCINNQYQGYCDDFWTYNASYKNLI